MKRSDENIGWSYMKLKTKDPVPHCWDLACFSPNSNSRVADVQYLFASPPVKSNQINRRCGYQGYWGTRIGCRNKIPTCLKAIGLQGVAHKFYL